VADLPITDLSVSMIFVLMVLDRVFKVIQAKKAAPQADVVSREYARCARMVEDLHQSIVSRDSVPVRIALKQLDVDHKDNHSHVESIERMVREIAERQRQILDGTLAVNLRERK